MADRRKVSVHLELEVARYLGSAAQATTATRRVSSSIDDLGDEADATGRDMTQLAANTDVAAHQIDDLGDEAVVTTGQLMLLERQLHSTGRAARGIDLTPDLGGMAGAGAAAGAQLGSSAARSFGRTGMYALRGPLIGVAVGAVAIMSPLIGAGIAGAVTGAVGLGGIIGGIASAAKDPAVKSAAKQFGTDISSEFFRGGGVFVQPVIDSLHILEEAFRDLDLASMFAKTAPFVTELAEGIGGFAREFGESFSNVLDRSSEIIPVIAQGLVRLGDGLGSMIEEMAASEGAIEGIRFLFEALAETAHGLGVVVRWLGDRFSELGRFSAGLSGALEDVVGWVPFIGGILTDYVRNANDQVESVIGTGEGFVGTLTKVTRGVEDADGAVARSDAWVPYQHQVDAATKALEEFNEAVEESISKALALDNANLGLQQAMLDLNEELRQGARDWRTNTQEGIDNRQALLSAVEAAERKRQADIASGVSADKANAAYQRTIDKLIAMARKAGITEKALQDLVGDYRINVHIRTIGQFPYPPKILETKGRQHGGPVHAGEVYRIHEGGLPEWFKPNMSGTVIPLSGMQSHAAGGRGGMQPANVRPLTINVSGTLAVQRAFDDFVAEVGNRGGTLAVIGIR
jgi:hypothetical protein